MINACIRRARLMLTLGGVVALAGCLPTSPERIDPYQGLLPAQQTSSGGGGLPVQGRGKSLGLLTSNSTEKQLAYIEDALKMVKTNALYNSHYRPDLEAALKPTYLFDSAVAAIRQRFGKVVVIKDLAEARSKNLDYAGIIDLAVKLPNMGGHNYAYDLNLRLLNRNQQEMGVIRGAGDAAFTSDCYGWGDAVIDCSLNTNVKAVRATLEQFRSELAAGVK